MDAFAVASVLKSKPPVGAAPFKHATLSQFTAVVCFLCLFVGGLSQPARCSFSPQTPGAPDCPIVVAFCPQHLRRCQEIFHLLHKCNQFICLFVFS